MNSIHQISQKLLVFVAIGALFLVCSCEDTSKKSKVTPTSTSTTTTSTENTATSTQNTTTPVSTDAVAYNPAHGQPGHRCDIAVGAPMNSPQKATTQGGSPVRNKSAVTPKVNPSHGQPGHRCDIAVGAPLE